MDTHVSNTHAASNTQAASAAVMGGTIGLTGGSLAGFALGFGGPVAAVALAAGAAYSTTVDGELGDCVRGVADCGLRACEKASELDQKHSLSAKLRSAGAAA